MSITDKIIQAIIYGAEGENGYFERKKQEFLRARRENNRTDIPRTGERNK